MVSVVDDGDVIHRHVARYEVDEIDLRDPDGDVDVEVNTSVSSRKPNPKKETSRSRSISIFRWDDSMIRRC
jgi:hypothetical protein